MPPSLNKAESRVVCTEHATCIPVSKNESCKVLKVAVGLLEPGAVYKNVENLYIFAYGDGLEAISERLARLSGTDDECVFCEVTDILSSIECYPFLAGLMKAKEIVAYERSLHYLSSEGEDVKSVDSWVRRLCSKPA
jgi:hypothetical protein